MSALHSVYTLCQDFLQNTQQLYEIGILILISQQICQKFTSGDHRRKHRYPMSKHINRNIPKEPPAINFVSKTSLQFIGARHKTYWRKRGFLEVRWTQSTLQCKNVQKYSLLPLWKKMNNIPTMIRLYQKDMGIKWKRLSVFNSLSPEVWHWIWSKVENKYP